MSKNQEQLISFKEYCEKHPEERFWQALSNWSGYQFIYVTNPVTGKMEDSYHKEGK